MSTRCCILIESHDGDTPQAIYHHHDGYLEGMGAFLQWFAERRIPQLINSNEDYYPPANIVNEVSKLMMVLTSELWAQGWSSGYSGYPTDLFESLRDTDWAYVYKLTIMQDGTVRVQWSDTGNSLPDWKDLPNDLKSYEVKIPGSKYPDPAKA